MALCMTICDIYCYISLYFIVSKTADASELMCVDGHSSAFIKDSMFLSFVSMKTSSYNDAFESVHCTLDFLLWLAFLFFMIGEIRSERESSVQFQNILLEYIGLSYTISGFHISYHYFHLLFVLPIVVLLIMICIWKKFHEIYYVYDLLLFLWESWKQCNHVLLFLYKSLFSK